MLLLAGADTNSLDKGGGTPLTNLMTASVRPTCLDPTVSDDVMTIIVLLQQMGADLNMNKCEYSNPLMVATLLKSAKLVEYFLGCGADPNVKCKIILCLFDSKSNFSSKTDQKAHEPLKVTSLTDNTLLPWTAQSNNVVII